MNYPVAESKVSNIDFVEQQQVEDVKPVANGYRNEPRKPRHDRTEAERRLLLKADMCILPLAALMYLVSYLVCDQGLFYMQGKAPLTQS